MKSVVDANRPKETKKRKSRAQQQEQLPSGWTEEGFEGKKGQKRSKEAPSGDKSTKPSGKGKGKSSKFADMPVLKPELTEAGRKTPKSPAKGCRLSPVPLSPVMVSTPLCSPVEKSFVDDKLDAFNRKFEALRKDIFSPREMNKLEETDSTPTCSKEILSPKKELRGMPEQMEGKTAVLTLNLTDPTSVVDNILKALKPDQLESFTKVFEEKLKTATTQPNEKLLETNRDDKKKKKSKRSIVAGGKPKNYELKFRSPRIIEELTVGCGYASDVSSVSRQSFGEAKMASRSRKRTTRSKDSSDKCGRNDLIKSTSSKQSNKSVPKATEIAQKLQDYRNKSRSTAALSPTFIDELEKLNQQMSEVLTIDPVTNFKFSSSKAFGFSVENFLLCLTERRHAEEMRLETEKRRDEAEKEKEKKKQAEIAAAVVPTTSLQNMSNLESEASDDEELQLSTTPISSGDITADLHGTFEMEKLRIAASVTPPHSTAEKTEEKPKPLRIKISLRHNTIEEISADKKTTNQTILPLKKRFGHEMTGGEKKRKKIGGETNSVSDLAALMKPLRVEVNKLDFRTDLPTTSDKKTPSEPRSSSLSPKRHRRYVTNIYPWDRVKLKQKIAGTTKKYCPVCRTVLEESADYRLCPTCAQLPFDSRVALLKENRKWRRAALKNSETGGLKCKFVLRKAANSQGKVQKSE